MANGTERAVRLGMLKATAALTSALFLSSFPVVAAPFTLQIGDNDGYGVGITDNGNSGGFNPYDGRSVAEQNDTNGAQFTDVYSALTPGFGPNTTSIGTVTFDLLGTMTSGTLMIDMADFQTDFGQFSVSLNGVSKPNYFNFNDGYTNTAIHEFVLSASDIANANLDGELTLTMDRNGSNDAVSFDYFRLSGEYAPTSVPDNGSTLALFGLTLGGMIVLQRKLSHQLVP